MVDTLDVLTEMIRDVSQFICHIVKTVENPPSMNSFRPRFSYFSMPQTSITTTYINPQLIAANPVQLPQLPPLAANDHLNLRPHAQTLLQGNSYLAPANAVQLPQLPSLAANYYRNLGPNMSLRSGPPLRIQQTTNAPEASSRTKQFIDQIDKNPRKRGIKRKYSSKKLDLTLKL